MNLDHGNTPRLLFDCTYTYTQSGVVGITRVVRKLAAELRNKPPANMIFCSVGYSIGGWRVLQSEQPARIEKFDAGASPSLLVRLIRLSTNAKLRRWIQQILPVSIQDMIHRIFSRSTYGRIFQHDPLVQFHAGDVLVLCDASWNYIEWKHVRKARKAGARVLTMVHDLIPINHSEFCAPLFTRVFEIWLRHVIRESNAIICNSIATRHEVEQYCFLHDLACPPIGQFRLGADLPEVIARHGLPEMTLDILKSDEPMFLMVGSVEPRKNHTAVLDACEALWREGAGLCLVIAGRISDGTEVVADRIRSHPRLGKQLFHLSNADDAELDALYRSATALVFASSAEGFGLPLVEARQRGCRVIANRIPVFVELADEGICFFDAESISDLKNLLRKFATAPPAHTSPMPLFTWQDSASQFLLELNRLLP